MIKAIPAGSPSHRKLAVFLVSSPDCLNGATRAVRRVLAGFGLVLMSMGLVLDAAGAVGADADRGSSITFNRDIAPILFGHCAGCHRPGASAPFSLLTFADAKKHSRTIVDVTRRRYMPPWLPEAGHEPLQDERRLREDEIDRLARWVEAGLAEGDAADLPPAPRFTDGWALGPPDLVVELSDPYRLPAEGPDVYRNFIIPLPTRDRRFVRAFEFRPGSRAVHHAFLRIDGTGQSRKLDVKDPLPGFDGMETPPAAESPSGYFLSWQPGRLPSALPAGLAWPLPAGADIVLLMHMQLLGKAEPVRPSIGFYFTDLAPTNMPVKIGLRSYAIDIPAGATNYSVEETVVLPVDSDLLAILPHGHYLARRIEAYARSPDGNRRSLLVIPDWDFNWQSDFRFAKPVALPAGTIVGMRFTFDNSTHNARNPAQPPVRVKFGLQTQDEMAELWLQLLPRTPQGHDRLETVAQMQTLKAIYELNQFRIRENPRDAEAHAELAKVHLTFGNLRQAEQTLRQALALKPDLDDGHYHLGLVYLNQSRFEAAEAAFLEALRINPAHFQARNNAGLACLRLGKLVEAGTHFQEALRLNPGDPIAQSNLRMVQEASRSKAITGP